MPRDPAATGGIFSPTPGDVDYDRLGAGYAHRRRTDPRIAACVHAALGGARTVLNVGAGAGSYEPGDRYVAAVEPSAVMRAQRPGHLSPAINASAEALPFDDRSFDASMAMLTVHQWSDQARGLAELRRVTRGPVVVMTFDMDVLHRFWLGEYAPELRDAEAGRFPAVSRILELLGGVGTVLPVAIPHDCVDGFTEAYYARPERFLDPAVRAAQSVWGFVAPGVQERVVAALGADLTSGEWDRRHGAWRTMPEFIGALRLVVSIPHA